jgi:citronellyl-CoA synthetase
METLDSVGLRAEDIAARFGDRPAVLFEGKELTWGEMNALANRYAHTLSDMGVEHGDTISVMMENRPEFIAAMIGINKLGATPALINTNLREKPLTHCITVTESKKCLIGAELIDAVAEIRGELDLIAGNDYLVVPDAAAISTPDWAVDFETASHNASTDNPESTQKVKLGDICFYIFTSGTTGLPKAAVLSHRRFLMGGAATSAAGLKSSEQDRLYLTLPLYHGTGLMIGLGSALYSGSSMFIRRKFSASRFLDEVREYNTNHLVYIGELCRYLLAQPERDDDADNPLTNMMGNGLRPDVWMEFKNRFGVKRITEFYGASEGNVSFFNSLNKDQTIGLTANKIALVAYDVDADEIVKSPDGRCQKVKKGEPGLLLARIDDKFVFEGYTDSTATEKKIIRNAFKDGDAWFNSGDLIRQINVGFAMGLKHYQFVDRVGDTFRWKSENVSTNEVGELINAFPQVEFCNVYGVEVPGADGRAGMAAIKMNDGVEALDVEGFSDFVARELPAYARPVFLRIQRDLDVTGTFKMVKGDLRKEGYDTAVVSDAILVMKPRSTLYEPLDDAYLAEIRAGNAGF